MFGKLIIFFMKPISYFTFKLYIFFPDWKSNLSSLSEFWEKCKKDFKESYFKYL